MKYTGWSKTKASQGMYNCRGHAFLSLSYNLKKTLNINCIMYYILATYPVKTTIQCKLENFLPLPSDPQQTAQVKGGKRPSHLSTLLVITPSPTYFLGNDSVKGKPWLVVFIRCPGELRRRACGFDTLGGDWRLVVTPRAATWWRLPHCPIRNGDPAATHTCDLNFPIAPANSRH
jgi:hypothetical protein